MLRYRLVVLIAALYLAVVAVRACRDRGNVDPVSAARPVTVRRRLVSGAYCNCCCSCNVREQTACTVISGYAVSRVAEYANAAGGVGGGGGD